MPKVGGPGPHSSKSGWATGPHGPHGSAATGYIHTVFKGEVPQTI